MKIHAPSLVIVSSIMSLLLGGRVLSAQDLAPASIPDAIKAPANQKLVHTYSAKGVQIYECRAKKDDPAQFEWTLKAPEADLFDASGKKVGRHYGGPTWESLDGSKVVGEVKGKLDSPDGSIPWLLLAAKTAEGSGAFGKVTSIQRISTEGGKAPAGGCDAAHSGEELRVNYNATYLFYVAKD
jgi:Protein of unknown function (DUF3455)